MHSSGVPDLFTPLPSGPQSAIPRKQANTHAAYLAWRRTREGLAVWAAFQDTALAQYRSGARRISTKAIAELVRASLRLEINNTHVSRLSDDLVSRYPQLLPLIERRARKGKAA